MIPIKHKDLDLLAQRHFEVIRNYVEEKPQKGKKKYDMKYFNNAIQAYFPDYNFEKIVLAKPNELQLFVNHWKNLTSKSKDDFKGFETYYDYLNDGDKFFVMDSKNNKIVYSAKDLVQNLNISVCPYCNRNFIHNVDETRTSELDHFYPKSEYPFLAISFYNLIPSCKVCNWLKREQEIGLNPYDNQIFDKIHFKVKIKDCNFYYDKNSIQVKLTTKCLNFSQNKYVAKNVKTFRLRELYENHTDIALDLIQKSITYNDSYIDELFQTYEGTLFRNREDVLRLVTANYISEEEFEKRPLAKLTHDIAKELGLIP